MSAERPLVRRRAALGPDLRILFGGLWGFIRQLLRSTRLRLFSRRSRP